MSAINKATVPADPTQWSAESQRSVAADFTTEYRDLPYTCWHCGCSAVFTAIDQKHTYEVKKANINQQRTLCSACWSERLKVEAELKVHEQQWAEAKSQLRNDRAFLSRWLELLTLLESYVPYRHDTARKGMLAKFLAAAP